MPLRFPASPTIISSDDEDGALSFSSVRGSSPPPGARSSSVIDISSSGEENEQDLEFESCGRIFVWMFHKNDVDPELIDLPRPKGVRCIEMARYLRQWEEHEMKCTDDIRVLKVQKTPDQDEWEGCKLGALSVRRGTTNLVLSDARVSSWNQSLKNAREHAYDGQNKHSKPAHLDSHIIFSIAVNQAMAYPKMAEVMMRSPKFGINRGFDVVIFTVISIFANSAGGERFKSNRVNVWDRRQHMARLMRRMLARYNVDSRILL
ncbi:unnamed protein product [Peniophora sp. CBMAI 1063]|nr:unnamed protein product [Peniophora sp. CBMAI 1063]